MVQSNDMALRPAREIVGSRVTLSDSSDGWFADSADLSGTIASAIQSNDNPCYVVEFDLPLELQESGADTVSGFTLHGHGGPRLGELHPAHGCLDLPVISGLEASGQVIALRD